MFLFVLWSTSDITALLATQGLATVSLAKHALLSPTRASWLLLPTPAATALR